ncbi:hypothetical protein NDU88_008001 [Pleurodeles waltl]|uniref:Uncharacterized protein n=1 Tax=Pleurodeles waltl TaxID=8319 RepID=A0AAV7VU71_PLEWA|nr:hypothetical protein NDU88_008001 [Pleurodeles waltl]
MCLGAAPLDRVSACEAHAASRPIPYFTPCACRLVHLARPGRLQHPAVAPPHCRTPSCVLRGRTALQWRAGPARRLAPLGSAGGGEWGRAKARGEAALTHRLHSSGPPPRRSPPASYLCPCCTGAL